MTEAGSEGNTHVRVPAPERVKPGDNLYDQPPFNFAIAHVSQTTRLTTEQVKAIVSFLGILSDQLDQTALEANNGNGEYFAKVVGKVSDQHFNRVFRFGKTKIARRNAISARDALLADLSPYPWWFQYVKRNTDESFFDTGGNWKKPLSISVESYATWLRKKLEREKHLMMVGIEEVFPQEFRGRSTSIVMSEHLVRRGITTHPLITLHSEVLKV